MECIPLDQRYLLDRWLRAIHIIDASVEQLSHVWIDAESYWDSDTLEEDE